MLQMKHVKTTRALEDIDYVFHPLKNRAECATDLDTESDTDLEKINVTVAMTRWHFATLRRTLRRIDV